MESDRDNKFKLQEDEQYLSVGKFLVKFEHLTYSMKHKLSSLCGTSTMTDLLLAPYSVKQTLDVLQQVVLLRAKEREIPECDINLYKQLFKDLRLLNDERNTIVHTTWFIGWRSETTVDLLDFEGVKYGFPHSSTTKVYTVERMNLLIDKCETYYRMFWTIWSVDHIENIPFFSDLWNRDVNGIWERKDS
ncbi:MAG: hypothetical protein ACK44D_03895 [Bacteroidia bacterium]